jgi:hypothetical protein
MTRSAPSDNAPCTARLPDIPVAPSTRTVPNAPTSSRRAVRTVQPDKPGFMPAAIVSGSAPIGSSAWSGVNSRSAIVPKGGRAYPV